MKKNGLKIFCATAVFCLGITGSCMGSSLQGMGAWWEAGDSGSTYGLGLRASLGDVLAVDLGWTYFGEGDDLTVNLPGGDEVQLGGIDANVFDLGLRYTLPTEMYFGGGLSYFDFDHDIASTEGEWGVYGLVGWSFGGEHFRGFVEGMYRYTEGTISYEDHWLEGTVDRDVEHDGFACNIGLMYRF